MPPSNNQSPQPPIWQQPSQPPLYPPPVAPPQAEPQLPEPQDPTPGYPEATTPQPSRRKRWLVVGVAAVVALIIGTATYLGVINKQETTLPDGVSNSQPVPMESLANASLIPPANLGRFQANAANSDSNMQYTTLDGACSLRMGIASAADLPGKDFDEIVKNQVKKLRDSGAVVQGPTGGTPLTVKNIADDGKAYTMPTAIFTASNKGTYTAARYSAAVLKDGSRAYAERVCETKEALATPAQLEDLDKDAATLTVVAP